MYQWPLNEIAPMRDTARPQVRTDGVASMLASAGLARSLTDFLAPFYDIADCASFFDGALRIHPLGGMPTHGTPDLIAWNDARGWKRHQPDKANDTFFFCSNVFGDLFGIPVNADGSVLQDRIGILWVERYEYQEAVVEWRNLFPRLAAEVAMAKFFLRLDEYAWAASTLGKPAAEACFSSNVPAVLGGSDTIENVAIQALVVHVSFTLQVIRQARQKAEAGAPLGIIELYDENGQLIP
jgi:hypothetical protein